MSNQCSNFLDFPYFSLFAPFHKHLKLHSTALNQNFPFHCDLLITSRRSRRKRTAPQLLLPLAAQSSRDIDLIATTKHHDGSLLFRFGDASEIVKNDESVEESKSEAKWESNIVKVLDGDQEREVIIKTIEREDGSSDGRRIDGADVIGNVDIDNDGIGNVDIDGDVIERDAISRDLSDYHAESSERVSNIPQEQEKSSQCDDKINSLDGLESTLDIRECSAQHDGDERLYPFTSSVPDNSINIDKTVDCLEVVVNDSNYESDDQLPSVKLEPTTQVSHLKVMDVNDPNAEDELHEEETKDTRESDTKDVKPLTTMQNLHVEVTDATNQNVDDGFQHMNIDENTLKGVMPPSYPLEAEPILDKEIQLEVVAVKLEQSMQVSTAMDAMDQVGDGLQQLNTDKSGENSIVDVKHVPHIREAEPIPDGVLSQLESAPVKLKLTRQVSYEEVKDITHQNLDSGDLRVLDEDAGESYVKDLKPSVYPSEAQAVQDEGVSHNTLQQYAEADVCERSIMLNQDADDPFLEVERIEGKVGSSEIAEVSEDTATLFATDTKVKREGALLADYILSSGAALVEHPSKALTGGDDAYFLAGSKWLGVANGVGRWSLEGTDRGVYAKELMKTCEKIILDSSSNPTSNPVELLCRGVRETQTSGSSTVLIANFDEQLLHVANIGDTGFMIIRHGAIYMKSSPMFHEFNFALQVAESDNPLQLLKEYRIELDEGDIVVSATDGLFDNLYEQEIAMIVSKSRMAGTKPEEIAKILATRVQEVGRSAFVRSPFADAAQAAGYIGCAGGKPDDVAVIVSLVEKRSKSDLIL